MRRIALSRSDRDILRQHAERCSPNESCAMLFGRDGRVSEVFLTENVEGSPSRFAISEKDLIEGYQKAEKKGTDVIAIFHSHPDSEAYPSETDKRFMVTNPVVWIIYSGKTGDLRAYFMESEVVAVEISE